MVSLLKIAKFFLLSLIWVSAIFFIFSFLDYGKKSIETLPRFKTPITSPILPSDQSSSEVVENSGGGTGTDQIKVECCSLKEGSPAPEKMIVVARYREDVSWLPIYLGDIPFIVYSKEEPASPFNVAPNLGQEVLPYLKFIVDHYDRLPKYTAFIHAHRNAWHNNQDMAELLRNLYWGKYQYTPLNADQWHTLVPQSLDYAHIRQAWPKIFQQELGDIPPQFTNHCCGQFVVSRERILAHPKQFYQKCFDWTASGDMETYYSSRVFEHTWSYIFGDEANPRQTISSYCDIAKVC